MTVKSLNAPPPTWFSNKRCCRLGKTLTFDENACLTSTPRGVPPSPPISHKSAAQAPHMLTFAPNPLTGTAFVDFRFNVASNPLHRYRICPLSRQIRCTGIAYADFGFPIVANPPHRHCICSLLLQVCLRFALKVRARRSGRSPPGYAALCFSMQ